MNKTETAEEFVHHVAQSLDCKLYSDEQTVESIVLVRSRDAAQFRAGVVAALTWWDIFGGFVFGFIVGMCFAAVLPLVRWIP